MKKITSEVFERHMVEWKASAAKLGIWDIENECVVPGKEANIIWLDEMPQFFQYLLDRGGKRQRVGVRGQETRATEVEGREQFTYDGAIGFDLFVYEPHLIFRSDYLMKDMFPPNLQQLEHVMVTAAKKGCQTGPTFLLRLKNLEVQARARGVEGAIMFCTDGHMSRFFHGVFQWLIASTVREGCGVGHQLYITPPHATGTCCILDQLFQGLHSAYAKEVRKLRYALGPTFTVGRWEAAQIMAGVHATWAPTKNKEWAWRKCGFARGDGIAPATVGVQHCPAGQFVIANTFAALELEIAAARVPAAPASPASPAAGALVAVQVIPPLPPPPLTLSTLQAPLPFYTPGRSEMSRDLRTELPTPSPSVPRGGSEYRDAKLQACAAEVVSLRRKSYSSPSAREARVFLPITKYYLTKPEGGSTRILGMKMYGSMVGSDLPAHQIEVEAQKVAKANAIKKAADIQRGIYDACVHGCSCEGEKCAAQGLYLCRFCHVLKKQKCGVKACKEMHSIANCPDMPIPPKSKTPNPSRRKHPTQGAATTEKSQNSDHSDPDADPVCELRQYCIDDHHN